MFSNVQGTARFLVGRVRSRYVLVIPGIDRDEDLEGQSEEEDGGREVGEDRLVETSGD